jgi:hypothetical protein
MRARIRGDVPDLTGDGRNRQWRSGWQVGENGMLFTTYLTTESVDIEVLGGFRVYHKII